MKMRIVTMMMMILQKRKRKYRKREREGGREGGMLCLSILPLSEALQRS